MLKSTRLPSLLLLMLLPAMSCRSSSSEEPKPSAAALRQSSWLFVQKTRLVAASGSSSSEGSGGFEPGAFPSPSFWPSTPLVVPAQAAAFINQTYGAAGGFTYQSFDFVTTSCSADNAFARYFSAIEQLRGAPLSTAEKDEVATAFESAFSSGEIGFPAESVCLLYDLMACIADYAVLNEAIVNESAASGDITAVMAGIASCIATITGIDPDSIDSFDPGGNVPGDE